MANSVEVRKQYPAANIDHLESKENHFFAILGIPGNPRAYLHPGFAKSKRGAWKLAALHLASHGRPFKQVIGGHVVICVDCTGDKAGLPSAADLDAVAAEDEARKATGGSDAAL